MPCVLSTKLVYENEARPVCFLSSDARRAEFLPNKLTVFLNGFRFFTRQHSRNPVEKFYDLPLGKYSNLTDQG